MLKKRILLAGVPIVASVLVTAIALSQVSRGPTSAEATLPTNTWTSTATPAFGYYAELDCHPATPGIQRLCTYPWNVPADIANDIVIGNNNPAPVSISYFAFEIRSAGDFMPLPGTDSNLNAAPDFNESAFGPGWTCTPPPPVLDNDPSQQYVSFLSCYTTTSSYVTVPGGGQLKLATLHYSTFPQISFGNFSLLNVLVRDAAGQELFSCNPILTTEGGCREATIRTINVFPTPTWTSTPSPTATPTVTPTYTFGPDSDSDGTPDNTDNCPDIANPNQTNTDGNLISNLPLFAQNDLTRARSDNLGDACDDDDDNDGVADSDDFIAPCPSPTPGPGPTPGPCGPVPCTPGAFGTAPFAADTDGDRFLDGVECTLGADPTNPASKPMMTACGLTTDADNDGLSNRIEYCFYNTDPAYADTDGDGVKDGCEATSFNVDTIVNVADLGMLASEISRAVPPARLVNLDVNKDGVHNAADLGMVAARVGKCP